MREPAILFATDFEGDVEHGLEVASRLAHDRSATLIMAHVMPMEARDGVGMLHSAAELASGESERAMRALSPGDRAVPYVSLHLVGEPEEELARVAAEYGVELLVMEVRPRSVVARMLGPGLVERMRQLVDCPVVTYRPRAPAEVEQASDTTDPLPPFVALEVMLNARVDALLDWLKARADGLTSIAHRPIVQRAVLELAGVEPETTPRRVRDELSLHLREQLRALDALGAEVWIHRPRPGVAAINRAPNHCVLTLGTRVDPNIVGPAWMSKVMREGAAVSLPTGVATSADVPIVLAGARVPIGQELVAALVFAFDARRGFLRILAQPGPTASAEIYAFDERGLMLSNSRFPDQLRQFGLLGPAMQTVGQLRVCDPGARLESSSHPPADGWPLTRMAASAIAGEDGRDTTGYRDYRGVPVMGVWRWVAEHRFGVAAEMDVAEAHPVGGGS